MINDFNFWNFVVIIINEKLRIFEVYIMSMFKFHISTVKELQSGYYIDGVATNLENKKYFLGCRDKS